MTQKNIRQFPANVKPVLFEHFLPVSNLSIFDIYISTIHLAGANKVLISCDDEYFSTHKVAMVEMVGGVISIERCDLSKDSSTKEVYHPNGNTQLFNNSVASAPVNMGARYVASVRSSVEKLFELARC